MANLYDYYNAQGKALPSVQERQGVATQAGIQGYTGTAGQNSQLLNYLQTPSTRPLDQVQSATPAVTPPPTNQMAGLDSLVASTVQPFNDAQTGVNTAQNNLDTTTTDLTSLMAQLGGQQADQNAADKAVGLDSLNRELIDLQNTARQQTIQYQTTPFSLEGQGRGITNNILRGQEAVTQRKLAIDVMVSNSNIAAKQGNILLAQNLADKAVAAKYDPIKQSIETKKFILEAQYKDLSRADKKLADAQQEKLAMQLKQVEKQEATDATIQSMVIDANAQGAPASVIKNAEKLAKNGATPAQIAVSLGKYSGAAAKAELLREQIKTEQTQRAKLNQDIAKSRADMSSGGSSVPKIQTINGVDMQWDGTKWVPAVVGTNPTDKATVTKSLDQIKFLKDTANKTLDKEIYGASGRSGARKTFENIAVGATDYTKLVSLTNTLKTNVLSLMTDPTIKKFFGPQMSNADVLLMTSAGTTLNPELNTPTMMKDEASRLFELFNRMETSIKNNTPEYQYFQSVLPAISQSSNGQVSSSDYANTYK